MDAIDRLKLAGLKPTPRRLRVLELILEQPDAHFVAEDLYHTLVKREVGISISTLYRVLQHLEDAEVLRKVQIGAGRSLYALKQSGARPGHIVSAIDGAVIPFSDPQLEQRFSEIARIHGFSMDGLVMTIYGRPVAL